MNKISLSKLVQDVLETGHYAMSDRTLYRRFQKLVAVCGGNMEALKSGNGNVYFDDEEASFIRHILKELAMNDGLSSLFIDKHRTDDYVGAKAVHDFIQSYLDELSKEGISEAELIRTMNFLSMLFLAPIHHMREECHSYIDGIFLNLQGYPYTHQAIMLEKLTTKMKKEYAEILVKSCLMVGDLADIIQRSKELCDDNIGMQDYGDDDVAVEYAERDRRVLQMIKADPDLRVYVEKKIGCAAETIFNVAAAKEGGTNGKTANASEDQHPEDVPVTPA
ncbi:hypothetical protein [Oscillibacter ruminantium]|mgnify:CR=1 FL=1|jgi:hypothetical protein